MGSSLSTGSSVMSMPPNTPSGMGDDTVDESGDDDCDEDEDDDVPQQT